MRRAKKTNHSALFELPLYAYARGRSLLFGLEYGALNLLSRPLPGSARFSKGPPDLKTLMTIRRELLALLKRDCENLARGVYPVSVLRPESAIKHLARIPMLIADGAGIYRRRAQGKTAVFENDYREFLDELPRYYRRNFHYQTDGYLSKRSAELYEHQVEMLFGGAADAMRRLIIPPLRQAFGKGDGKGLAFLEVGAGTGRATRFVRLAFPKAKIVALDLSEPYLKKARWNLKKFNKIDFLQGSAEVLPFEAKRFDAAYSVFMYHELPRAIREQALEEQKRVVKKNGFVGLVDSLQLPDAPEFEAVMGAFPRDFHEPFYRDYVEHPIESAMKVTGLSSIKTDRGFLSKSCWAKV